MNARAGLVMKLRNSGKIEADLSSATGNSRSGV
jgi:hypothetical protein